MFFEVLPDSNNKKYYLCKINSKFYKMKRTISTFMLISLTGCILSCTNSKSNRTTENIARDSIAAIDSENHNDGQNIVDEFFKDFQEKNVDWTKTTKGHKKLITAFKNKITTDIQFAKACASYNTKSEYDNSIATTESIYSYSKDDGEEGEIKAFDFVIDVKLVKPLYNGQKEISVKYEIISTIPSTTEEHWRPYIINYCCPVKHKRA